MFYERFKALCERKGVSPPSAPPFLKSPHSAGFSFFLDVARVLSVFKAIFMLIRNAGKALKKQGMHHELHHEFRHKK